MMCNGFYGDNATIEEEEERLKHHSRSWVSRVSLPKMPCNITVG